MWPGSSGSAGPDTSREMKTNNYIYTVHSYINTDSVDIYTPTLDIYSRLVRHRRILSRISPEQEQEQEQEVTF